MRVEGAIALVTGANRGLGLALVEALLEAGAATVYAAARDPARLDGAVSIDAARVRPLALDITDAGAVTAAAAAAGDATLLINNAGVLDYLGPLEADQASIDRNMATNFLGTYAMTRAFAPVIAKQGGGAVVNILSFLSFVSAPIFASYNASKAASWSMAMSLRPVLAPTGVAVVNAFPTTIATEMVARLDKPKDSAADMARAIVQGVVEGQEDIYPMAAAQMYAAYRADPKAVERRFAAIT